jgi:NTP pyrophosphatase (non-canonical NTP hydrolase)
MLTLNKKPTIADYQDYVRKLEIERGFQHEDVLQKCLLLIEEVGELYEFVIDSKKKGVGEELADIVIVLFAIINRFEINPEEFFEKGGLNEEFITMPALQRHVEKKKFSKKDVIVQYLVLGQEVGKLCKAIRKQSNVTRIDHNSKFVSIQEVSAKILLLLCQIANCWDIDLEQAFREKESINKRRIWQ